MENLKLTQTSTCLSPNVHKLIIHHTSSEERDENVLGPQRLLNFSYISNQLPVTNKTLFPLLASAPIEDGSFTGDPAEYFSECVRKLAPMIHSVEDCMSQLSGDELHRIFENFLTWTGQSHLLLDLWESLYDDDSVTDMLVLLVTTAVLERSLGDIYLTKGSAPCPSMLKDLLVTKDLMDIVGKDVIQLLRVFIGPPTSLNLRNVIWHGFSYPGEIPKRCVWFIVLLVPSIGQILHDKGITSIAHREPVKLPNMVKLTDSCWFENNSDSWIESLTQSTFVSWRTKSFWSKVVSLLQDGRYAFVSALLLCYLENGLRRIFAAANNCHHRVLTAEATTLYTTFDEILDPTLPDGSSNQLLNILGTQSLEILMDLLMYQDGPRIRDHLSHGELCWEPSSVSMEIVHNLYILTLYLATKCIPTSCNAKINGLSLIIDNIRDYKVQFHRIAVIQNLVQENVDTACNIDSLVSILPDLSQRQSGVLYPLSDSYVEVEANVKALSDYVSQNWAAFKISLNMLDSISYRTLDQFSKDVRDISSHKIPTLYREKQTGPLNTGQIDREGELLSVLHHITIECRAVLNHVVTCLASRQKQLKHKELRSRQRENFKKFLSCFQCYVLMTSVCGLLVQWQLHHLDAHNLCAQHSVKQRIKVWKSMLQFCENLRTFSHPDKNKWNEGLELIMKFTRSVCGDFNVVFTIQTTDSS